MTGLALGDRPSLTVECCQREINDIVGNAIVGSEQVVIERSNAMFILSEHSDAIGTLTLNQPAKRNALSEALVEELAA